MSLPVAISLPDLNPVHLFGEGVSKIAESAVGALASAVADAVSKILVTLGTVWVKIGTPNVTTADGTTASGPVAFVQSQLWWFMAAAAIAAVMVGGARMAWEQRGEPGRELLKGLLTLVVVSGCGLAVVSLAIAAADEFSASVINASTQNTDFGQNLTAMLGIASATSGGVLGPMLVIILGLIAIFVSVVQIMLMVVRAGMLVLLTGALPLAASFTSTEIGRTWFRRFTSWLLAFILYKPAAAIIYATAFRLAGSDVFADDGLLKVLVGLALMVMSIVALPALLRFLAPMTAAVASGGGGGAGAAAMLAAAGPTGAMAVGRAPALAGAGGGAASSAMSAPSGAASASGGGAGPASSGSAGGAGASGAAGRDGSDGSKSAGGGDAAGETVSTANGGGGSNGAQGASAGAAAGGPGMNGAAGGNPAGRAGSGGGGKGSPGAESGGGGASGAGGAATAGGGLGSGGASAAGAAPAGAGAAAADAARGAVKKIREEASAGDDQEEGPDGAKR